MYIRYQKREQKLRYNGKFNTYIDTDHHSYCMSLSKKLNVCVWKPFLGGTDFLSAL